MGVDRLPVGTRARIVAIEDVVARQQMIRLGFPEGADIEVVSRIPLGPVVIRRRDRQVAVGRDLARRVRVDRV
jgi:Fe2+ transport system protein FeoA